MKCLFCEAREHIEREMRERFGDEAQVSDRTIHICECGGVRSFIAYGLYPTSQPEAREFIAVLLNAFELSEPPSGWKENWPKFLDVIAALERHSTLASFAAELDVSIRTAQEMVKQATGGRTFREYQAEKRGRGKSRWGLKLRRRRR